MCVTIYCSLNTMLTLLRRYRYLMYRSFVSWCWGCLGRRIRVVLPSCMVLRIRRDTPYAQGMYVGFRPALDWTLTCSRLSLPACQVFQTGQRDPQGWGTSAPHPHPEKPCQRWGTTRLSERLPTWQWLECDDSQSHNTIGRPQAYRFWHRGTITNHASCFFSAFLGWWTCQIPKLTCRSTKKVKFS